MDVRVEFSRTGGGGNTPQPPVDPEPPVFTGLTIDTTGLTTHHVGDSLRQDELIVYAHYSIGDPVKLGPTEWTYDPQVFTEAGQVSVSIAHRDYPDKPTSIIMSVDPVLVTGLEVITPPEGTVYLEGETFDPTGMVIRVIYNNGDHEDITWTSSDPKEEWAFDPSGPLGGSDDAVTITHSGETCRIDVDVVTKDAFYVIVSGHSIDHGDGKGSIEQDIQEGQHLNGYVFDTGLFMPGMVQTFTLEIHNTTGRSLDSQVYLSGMSTLITPADRALAERIVVSVGNESHGLLEMEDDPREVGFMLGDVPHMIPSDPPMVVSISISFVADEGDFAAMGGSVGFTLGVRAGSQVAD